MFWITRDHAALRPYSFKEQLKVNLFYRLASKMAKRGFFKTEEGAYIRLKDFTPFFWRTLLERKDKRIKSLNEEIEWLNMEIRGDQATMGIVVAAIVKAAGGEVRVTHGMLHHSNHLAVERDPLVDATTYRIV